MTGKQERQQIWQRRDTQPSQSQHLAIYATANNNIWIRGAELKGKNVIWALQQQLQTTQKAYIRQKKYYISKQTFSCIGCLPSQVVIYSSLPIKGSAFDPQNQMHTVDSISSDMRGKRPRRGRMVLQHREAIFQHHVQIC